MLYERNGKLLVKRENKIAVIGGDQRQLFVAEYFAERGYKVAVWGLDTYGGRLEAAKSLSAVLYGAFAVILPLPTSKDGLYLNFPLSDEKLTFEELIESVSKEQILIGGHLFDEMLALASKRGIRLYDCMESESFKVMNAIPTSEGAVGIAMNELQVTLFGSTALVCGFGRIGKILSGLLLSMGCHVLAAARKDGDLAFIRAFGYEAVRYSELCDAAERADVIFNTAPAKILTRPVISHIRKDVPVIDLASLPGGVDEIAAEECGVKVIHALSLPGKVAPVSAGRIMAQSIDEILCSFGSCPIRSGVNL